MKLDQFIAVVIGILSQYMNKGSEINMTLKVSVLRRKEDSIIIIPDQCIGSDFDRHVLNFKIRI